MGHLFAAGTGSTSLLLYQESTQPGPEINVIAISGPDIRQSDLRVDSVRSENGDPLSELLRPCRIECVETRAWRLVAPWNLDFAGDGGAFLIVRDGACLLRRATATEDQRLGPGDVAFWRGGGKFQLLHSAGERTLPGSSPEPSGRSEFAGPEQLATSGRQSVTRLSWAAFSFDDEYTRQTLALLPELLVARGDGAQMVAGLSALVAALPDELEETRPGGKLVRDLFIQALLTCVLRGAALELPAAERLSAALRTPGMGLALGAIHADPRRNWSVAELAEVAELSRSSFSAAFTEALGRPPFEYLRQVRMQLACRLLRETNLVIKEIAAQAGYSNKASFSKAFAAACGCAPSAYRRRGA